MNDKDDKSPFKLGEALTNEDDLIVVVRGHIYLEVQLNRFLDSMFPFPEEISRSRFSWPQKVELALSLGLNATLGN